MPVSRGRPDALLPGPPGLHGSAAARNTNSTYSIRVIDTLSAINAPFCSQRKDGAEKGRRKRTGEGTNGTVNGVPHIHFHRLTYEGYM